MSLALIIYLVGMLDTLAATLMWGSIGAAVVGCPAALVAMLTSHSLSESDAADHKAATKIYKRSAAVLLCCLSLNILVPSKGTAYVIIAAYGVEGLVSDERVQQLGGKSLDVIEKWLDKAAAGGGE